MERRSQDSANGTFRRYVTGFLLSLAFTLTAYAFTMHHLATHHQFPPDAVMVIILSALAISQLVVQLVCFLHLDRGSKPRWNLAVLLFAAIVIFILVAGSIWIMYNLNYRMSTPQQINRYMQSQDDL